MGSTSFWYGKQDDPALRRGLTEDLERIFTAIDWKFEVWHPDKALNASVRFPHWLHERLLGRRLGVEESYRHPEEKMMQVVFREGVVVHFGGRSEEHRREMSFAFLDGPDIPVVLKNRIYSLSDFDRVWPENSNDVDGMPPDRNIPTDELVDGGRQRFIMGWNWPVALLLMLIKRLYVPGLYFSDDYSSEKEAGEWAEKVRLFLSPGEGIRELLLSEKFQKILRGEEDEADSKRVDNEKLKSIDSSGGAFHSSIAEMTPVARPRIRVNPEPEYSRHFLLLVEWLASKDPSRLPELYRWMGECGHVLSGRVVVFQDAAAFFSAESADLFIFPIWEIIARLPRISQCFEVNLQSLKDEQIDDAVDIAVDIKEKESDTAGNEEPPAPVPTEERGTFIRVFLKTISGDEKPVLNRLAASEWIMEKTRKKTRMREYFNWHYWDGFIVGRLFSLKSLSNKNQMAVSWTIIPKLIRFVDKWEFSRCGGVAILADSGEDYFSLSNIPKMAGLRNLAALVQMGKEEVRSAIFSTSAGSKESFNEVIDFFDDEEHGPKEAVLQLGVDLRERLFGPEPAYGTFWPLAVTKACQQATCLKCIQNVSGETVDIRICALRKIRIEKEHEDFCTSYQRKSDYSSSMSIIGPVYRMMAGGPVGFRPLGVS